MTPGSRAANAFKSLPADQRAAVELVLRRGHSYAELAGLLGIPEATVRERAIAALEALAPDTAPPARAAEVADWLLGQQAAVDVAATRELLVADAATREWALTVAAALRELTGAQVPEPPSADLPEPRSNGSGRARPLRSRRSTTPPAGEPDTAPVPHGGEADTARVPRDGEAETRDSEADAAPVSSLRGDEAATRDLLPYPPDGDEAAASELLPYPPRRDDDAAATDALPVAEPGAAPPPAAVPASPGRSSRLGGAILIGVVVLAVAAVLIYVLTRGDDSSPAENAATPPAATATATVAATATGTPEASPDDIVLRGPAGSKAVGLMRLFRANDDTVRFALAAQDVTPNVGTETYSIWFVKQDGSERRLGVAQGQVGKTGTLTTAGPRNEDVQNFPQWFASYDKVLVTRDRDPAAKRHGTVILSGDLPHSTS